MLIPQPWLAKMPGLSTNLVIRTKLVLNEVRGKLLDIGCGSNELVKAYRAQGGNGMGVDVYPWAGVDQVLPDSSCLPFADQSFDAVSFIACINHIPYREQALREAHRVLTADGILILTNLTPWLSRIWHFYAFWDHDQHERGMAEGEVWGLTSKEMLALLTKTGFKVQKKILFSWGCNQLYVCSPIK